MESVLPKIKITAMSNTDLHEGTHWMSQDDWETLGAVTGRRDCIGGGVAGD